MKYRQRKLDSNDQVKSKMYSIDAIRPKWAKVLEGEKDQWRKRYTKMYSPDAACKNGDVDFAQNLATNIEDGVLYD